MGPQVSKIQTPISLPLFLENYPPRDRDKAFILYFQHLLEALVEEVYKSCKVNLFTRKMAWESLPHRGTDLQTLFMAQTLKLFNQVMNSNLGFQQSSGSSATWECDLSKFRGGVGRTKIQYVIYHVQVIRM